MLSTGWLNKGWVVYLVIFSSDQLFVIAWCTNLYPKRVWAGFIQLSCFMWLTYSLTQRDTTPFGSVTTIFLFIH